MRTVIPIDCGQRFRSIADSIPVIADSSTDENIYVDFVREGLIGNGSARTGNARWRRLTEKRSGSAKSVFHFDVQGSVAKSTHAGIPWLHFIRQRLGERVHFWPFGGWDIPVSRSAIAEVYPRLWSRDFAPENRTGDEYDAYSIAAWLRRVDHDGSLAAFLKPVLTGCRAMHDIENARNGSRQTCRQSMDLRFSGWPCRIIHFDVIFRTLFELEGGDNLFQFVLREPPQIPLR
jgi:hypothetical protein